MAVSGVEPLQARVNAHNVHYLRTKILKMDHAMELPAHEDVHASSSSSSSSGGGGSTSGRSASSGSLVEGGGGATTPEEAMTEASSDAASWEAGAEEQVGMGLLEEEEGGEEEERDRERERPRAPAPAPRSTAGAAEQGQGQGEAGAAGGAAGADWALEEFAEPPRYAFGRETVEAAIQAIAEVRRLDCLDLFGRLLVWRWCCCAGSTALV